MLTSADYPFCQTNYKIPETHIKSETKHIMENPSGESYYRGIFNLSPKFIDQDYVSFQINANQFKRMALEFEAKLDTNECSTPLSDVDIPLDLSPAPVDVSELSGSQDETVDEVNSAKSPVVLAEEMSQSKMGSESGDVSSDEDSEMDCFSFNFSIKKSFFTQNGSSPQQQEVLLMDRMMKHCFGYIILSRGGESNGNDVTFRPKSSQKDSRASPAESFTSSIADLDNFSHNFAAGVGKSRNKRKRVMPQQRDTVIIPSPNRAQVIQNQGASTGLLANLEAIKASIPSESGNSQDSIVDMAMDLSSSFNNNNSSAFKPIAGKKSPPAYDACSKKSTDDSFPLDLTWTKVKNEQQDHKTASKYSRTLQESNATSIFNAIESQSNAFAQLQQQQAVANILQTAAGFFPQFGASQRSPSNSFLSPGSSVAGSPFASFLNTQSHISHLFGNGSPNYEQYLPPPKKQSYISKMKEEAGNNLLGQLSGQSQERSPLASSGKQSKGANSSPSTTPKEMISCGVCGKRFKTWAYIKDHMRLHTGEKPFQCIHCPACFPNKSHLNYHVKSKHHVALSGNPLDSPLSGIPLGTALDASMDSASILRCELCLRQFNSKSALTLHSKRCGQRTESVIMSNANRTNSPMTSPRLQFYNDCASVMPQAAPGGALLPSDNLTPAGSTANQTPTSTVSNLFSISSAIEATIQSMTAGLR